MADKYERWNKWAPQFIADLVHDFKLTPGTASGFPGNFAAESAYFNDIVEDAAIAKGWKGGTGFAQWTGTRRLHPVWGFEAWCKRKGWAADSYEANYSYLFRELKGIIPFSISGIPANFVEIMKGSKSPENAAWRVLHYYEKPKHENIAPRARAAREALALYEKNPPKPTVWATDKQEVIVPTPTPIPGVIPPVAVAPDTSRPAVPWFKSLVFTGASGGLGASIYALVQAYQPGVPILNQLDTLMPLGIAAIGTATAVLGRVTSTAQPLTTSQAAADKIGEAKAAATAVVAAAQPVHEAWAPPLSPEERAQGWTTVQPQDIPMDHLPLNKVRHEITDVADSVLDIIQVLGRLSPALGALGEIGRQVNSIREASQAAKEGEKP